MANRYWVGGAGTWNTTSTTNWSASSGGASGASAPTATDNIFFDQAGTYTVSVTAGRCQNITVSNGTVTFLGVTTGPTISGSMSLAAGTVWNIGASLITTFNATTTGQTITTNGVSLSSQVTFNGVGGGWTLGSALTLTQTLIVTNGSFNSGNFAITASAFSSNNSNTRSISLNSSTVTISTNLSTALNLATTTNLTWNAGTSQINLSGATSGISSGGLTFYNVSFTSVALVAVTITGANTFNNLTFQGRNTAGVGAYTFSANQTINGKLWLNTSSFVFARHFLLSDTIGTQRTLICNAVDGDGSGIISAIDFRDIAFAGNCVSIGNISGFYLGDCKGNSNITFDSPKTVYYRNTGSANWGTSVSWAATSGGTADSSMFPLAQDVAVFPAATYPASGATTTINANYNIGTIDMSLRTSNTMTLATGTTTPQIYGNWINGTGTTLTGTGQMTFAGRGSQTVTSAGKTFTQTFTINSPSGSVTLQDAFTTTASGFTLTLGTFDAANYNVTFSSSVSGLSLSGTGTRTLAIGSGTWVVAGNSGTVWNATTTTNFSVTGTGILSFTGTGSRTFSGGNIQTYPTLNQGGTGALTITGSNGFRSMTNTAIGSVLFTGGTTNTFSVSFSLNGALANLLTLGSTNTTQAILKKPTSWQMGLTSVDAGNNTGLTFLSSDGTMSYLSVSYINGQLSALPYTGNFFAFF